MDSIKMFTLSFKESCPRLPLLIASPSVWWFAHYPSFKLGLCFHLLSLSHLALAKVSLKLVLPKTSVSIFGPCQIDLDRTKCQRLWCRTSVLWMFRQDQMSTKPYTLLQFRQWLCNGHGRGAMRMGGI